MGNVKSKELDPAQLLTTDEDLVVYLDSCIDDAGDDAAQIAEALGTVVRAKFMNQLARDTGIGIDALYMALSADGDIKLSTVLKVTKALGLQLGAWSPTIKVEACSPCFKPSRE
jgi:probable addiction module antidote protein